MPDQTRIVTPGIRERTVRSATKEVLQVPAEWILVSPGDPALTRRIKAAGPTWTVQEKRGRKIFSRGVWASQAIVDAVQAQLVMERATPQHAKKREASARRREREQASYEISFQQAVLNFLAFDPCHQVAAEKLAQAVTEHATPVGSGTVARTQRIPIEQRAEAAVIAWLRHQTTAYDQMAIPRVKGKRREVRRLLAQRSKELLHDYRAGKQVDASTCPLAVALGR
jgi:hypothetical protein